MKKHQISLLTILVIAFLSSCAPTRMLQSNVQAFEVKEMAYFEPLSYIRLIEKKNKSTLNDSLSQITKAILDTVLLNNKQSLHISKKIEIKSDTLKFMLENEIAFLVQSANQRKSLQNLKLTPVIDSIMERNNTRFALAIVATGFGRKKGNYGREVAKGAAIGILTLGMYYQVPVKSDITLYGIICDSEKNEIAFYNKTLPIEKPPTNKNILIQQTKKLFEGYFYAKK